MATTPITNNTSNRQFAVVTGASKGIGLELAKQFAKNGFDLLIVADSGQIDTAANELKSLGASVQTLQADLAEHEGMHSLQSTIQSAGRPVDAIAINAGVGVAGRFVETDLAEEMKMVRLNVMSTLHLAKFIVKHMVARGKGRILITASIAGTMPTPYEAVYGATKAFDRSLAQSLREELKETGVTVTALMPGATETNFFHRAGADDTKLGASEKDDPAEVAEQGFKALMNGDDHVVAGSFKNKLQAAAGYALPDPLVAKAHAGMSEPGSANKK
jgi:short-subunit dehydrogenase